MEIKILEKILFFFPCHRKKNRCLKVRRYTMPLCARCFAIYSSICFTPIIWFLPFNSMGMWIAFGGLLPLLIDGYTQRWGWRESTNVLRLSTGWLFGCSLHYLMLGVVLHIPLAGA